ncbi:3-ketoacyl-CoA thiolase with broad chain length specificity [Clonorchis sinensis]|uniref:Protection of telomeres protein 1 n=1 Tax=Clonorchis sinensis TaxID=79923 RepID=A0A8T1M8R3_CLOSI|nr:3-ketoacyl-CoA thiolase with broad chain length specificity [Clonorchis sinensis]
MTSNFHPVVEAYQYTNLKDAAGSVNVIAVVKFHRAPVKTRGSGYSLFVTVTDPSLHGAKLPCVFFNDALDKLPQVQCVGDVILMHRLIVKEFRGECQGCGYGTVGFSATVFSGSTSDPLVPRPSKANCSFGDEELRRVRELREWFNSPGCPVEREPIVDHNDPSQSLQRTKPASLVKRLWCLQPEEFTSTEGQVVAIYRYPQRDRCCLLYVWDGAPPFSSSTTLPSFMRPPKGHMVRLSQNAHHDPKLCAITAHESSCPSVDDWSVPVFIYDEHASAPVLQNLKPGDIVRIHNLHVTLCRPVSTFCLECDKDGCLRLLVHGGGHRFGRGLQLLRPGFSEGLSYTSTQNREARPDDSFSVTSLYSLSSNLQDGIKSRPFYLELKVERPAKALTVSELCAIPATYQQLETEKFGLSSTSLFNTNSSTSSTPPHVHWFPVTSDGANRRNRTVVMARLMARVLDIFPRTVDDLKNVSLLICSQCHSAIRVSCLDVGELPCSCHLSRTSAAEGSEIFMLAPFVFLKVEDPTGQLIVCASFASAIALLMQSNSSSVQDRGWKQITNELLRPKTSDGSLLASLRAVHQLSFLLNQPVNLVLELSWLAGRNVNIPLTSDKLQLRFDIPNSQHISWVWQTRS